MVIKLKKIYENTSIPLSVALSLSQPGKISPPTQNYRSIYFNFQSLRELNILIV